MRDPLLPPPNSKKRNFGERNPTFLPLFSFFENEDEKPSPPFSVFENGGETAGVNFPLKASSPKKKRFILEFQVLIRVCPKTPRPVIARRFLPKQSPCIITEIASSPKTLLAMTVPGAFADRH